jgi:hypothetical protein
VAFSFLQSLLEAACWTGLFDKKQSSIFLLSWLKPLAVHVQYNIVCFYLYKLTVAPNLSLKSDPACIAFRSLSTFRYLGSVRRLGAGVAA